MISQLFVGFISYVMNRLDAHNLERFQDEVTSLVEELQDQETEDIAWYSDLKEYWFSQINEEEIDEGEEKFLDFIKSLDTDQILQLDRKSTRLNSSH